MTGNVVNKQFTTRIKCKDCPIRHRAVCSTAHDSELALMVQIKSYTMHRAGDPILWCGDDMQFVASIVDGVATLGQTLEDGRTQVVGLLLDG